MPGCPFSTAIISYWLEPDPSSLAVRFTVGAANGQFIVLLGYGSRLQVTILGFVQWCVLHRHLGYSRISIAASKSSGIRQEICLSKELIILFTHDTNSVIMGNIAGVSSEFAYGRRFLAVRMSFGLIELQ